VPGYKALPSQYSDDAADRVRYAEVLLRAGDRAEAVRMLESSLDACTRVSPELPGWLCGRLASLYRALGRHDDEVLLLERYRESQDSEDASSRFDARLSKARAIAERKRRSDTRALSSIRCVINGCEDEDVVRVVALPNEDDVFAAATVAAMREAFTAAGASGGGAVDLAPFAELCAEAHGQGHPAERLVVSLKAAWICAVRPSGTTDNEWDGLYRDALTRALACYFADSAP
jgi:hypothetical protein